MDEITGIHVLVLFHILNFFCNKKKCSAFVVRGEIKEFVKGKKGKDQRCGRCFLFYFYYSSEANYTRITD